MREGEHTRPWQVSANTLGPPTRRPESKDLENKESGILQGPIFLAVGVWHRAWQWIVVLALALSAFGCFYCEILDHVVPHHVGAGARAHAGQIQGRQHHPNGAVRPPPGRLQRAVLKVILLIKKYSAALLVFTPICSVTYRVSAGSFRWARRQRSQSLEQRRSGYGRGGRSGRRVAVLLLRRCPCR